MPNRYRLTFLLFYSIITNSSASKSHYIWGSKKNWGGYSSTCEHGPEVLISTFSSPNSSFHFNHSCTFFHLFNALPPPFVPYDTALESESVWKFHSNTMDPPPASLYICSSICLWGPFVTSLSPISHSANTSSETHSIPLLSKLSWLPPKQDCPVSSLNDYGTSFICLLRSFPHCSIVTCGRGNTSHLSSLL